MKIKMLLSTVLAGSLTFGLVAGASADVDWRKYEGTELRLLYIGQSYFTGLQELASTEFEELTGIKVTIDAFSEAGALAKAQLELAAGKPSFDIIGIQSGNMPLYAQNKWVTPVDSFFGNSSLSDPDQLNLDDFISSTMNGLAVGDTQYCLPWFAATIILYYNLDLFEAAGITEPPKTYEELLKVAAAVHTDKNPAFAVRGAPASAAGNIWPFNAFFHGAGAKYFADFPNDMTPTVNSPEAVRALEVWAELQTTYAPEGTVNFKYDDVVTAIQQGTVAMVIDGAPLAGMILHPDKSKVHGKLGFAVMPGGKAGPKPAFAAHGLCVSAFSDEDKQAASYMFLEWATSADTMLKIGKISQYLAVPRHSVWENPSFVEKYDYDFGGGSFLKAYQDSLAAAPADHYPPFPAWGLVGSRMGQAVQEVHIGQKTAADALNDANEDIAEILKEEGYLE